MSQTFKDEKMQIEELVDLMGPSKSADSGLKSKSLSEETGTASTTTGFIHPELLSTHYDSKTKVSRLKKEIYETIQCTICLGKSNEMMAAKCGHIACDGCWVA